MNYLTYIEHAPENLQFFLWLKQYKEKFEQLPESEKALSKPWTMSQAESEKYMAEHGHRQMKVSADTASALKGTGLDNGPKISESEKNNPFGTPERTPSEETDRAPMSVLGSENGRSDTRSSGWLSDVQTQNSADTKKRATEAFGEAGQKLAPCKQPGTGRRPFRTNKSS